VHFRLLAAGTAAALLAPLAVAGPAGATHDGSGPHARATDDSCPAGQVPPAFFTDVSRDNAHRDGIDCVVWWDVASGRGQDYAPAGEVSREQMATFLRNLVVESGGTLPTPTKDHFTDDESSFYEDSINALAEAGIVAGRGGGSYAPNAPVERGAMATFLVKAYGYRADQALPAPNEDAFSDDNGTTHEGSTNKAAAAGFAAGVSGSSYAPQRSVQRDQMASFLARVLDLLVEDRLAQPPAARAGDVDPAFGDRGTTSLSFGTAYAEANDVALYPDGKVLLAGFSSGDDDQDPTQHVAVARLLADGSPDPAFGGDGQVTTQRGASSHAVAAVVQSDGKVVVGGRVQPVAGEFDSDFLLVRYNTDGSLDTTFGDGGLVTTSFAEPAYLADLALQDDGGIVAAGTVIVDGDAFNGSNLVVARYLPENGSLDPAFGARGTTETDVRGGADHFTALVVQPDGAIVVAGASDVGDGTPSSEITLVRYLADGSLDPSFGDAGVAHTETGFFETLTGVSPQADGAIVAAGYNYNDERTVQRILVVRYDAAGQLDPTFGDGGVVITEAAPQSEAADVTVDADDRVLVVGHGREDADENGKSWLVVRYSPDGAQDASFGENGVVRAPIGKRANALALQDEGIVVAGCDCPFQPSGRGGVESHSSFVVARFRP
jgi:uncharacterized delta-60 repeat protein